MTIVHFRAEGLHVVFLGDLGHPLDEAELAPLRGADVVLAAAGGPPTIDFPDIPPLLDAIGPRLIVPMHYKTPKINLNIQPVERFLEALPGVPVDRPGRASIEVEPRDAPRRARGSSCSSTRGERSTVRPDQSSRRRRITSSRTARMAGKRPPKTPIASVIASGDGHHQRAEPER